MQLIKKIDDKLKYGRLSPVIYKARMVAHARHIPELSPGDRRLADELVADGGTVTHLDDLDLPITEAFRAAVAELLPALPQREAHRPVGDPLVGRDTSLHCISMDPPELAARFPELIRFGLEERLLDIIEAYLGVPVAFTTVHLRKDIGGGNQVGTRFWHLDTEDVRVIRMMVYLNDVTLDDGPFEYISRPVTDSVPQLTQRALRSEGDPIFDDEMRRHIPESEWRPITGPAGTVLLADNAVCYHHGKVHDSERIVLIYTYTSRHPRYPELTRNPSFDDVLTPRQRAANFVDTSPPV
jgi:hypothetical protein